MAMRRAASVEQPNPLQGNSSTQELGRIRRSHRTHACRNLVVAAARPIDAARASYPNVLTAPSKGGKSISGSVWESLDEVELEEILAPIVPKEAVAREPSQLLEQPMYYMRPQHPSAQQVIGNGTGGFRYVDGRVQQGPYTSGPNANIEPPNKSLYGFAGVLIGTIAFLAEFVVEII